MCIEEEIEMLNAEFADVKDGEFNLEARKRLVALIEKCNQTIKSLKNCEVGISRLRADYFSDCKEQVHTIKCKAQSLLNAYYTVSFSVVEL